MTRALRTALVMSIPILMIGSFSLILKSLPIPAYQRFLEIFLGGALLDILDIAHRATFGIFSLYMVLAVSRNYSQDNSSDPLMFYGAPIASLISFVILCGFFRASFNSGSRRQRHVHSPPMRRMYTSGISLLC